jgi:hypothetical protein
METGGEQESVRGIYLFCFARPHAGFAVEGHGLDDGNPLQQTTLRDVMAVLCEVAVEKWCGPSGDLNLQDLAWVAPRACRHEQVIEQVMRHSPVLPSRFGTLFSSFRSVESVVDSHYAEIDRFLDYVADKEEWGIKVLLDSSKAEERLLAPKLSALPPGAGARYLLEQRLRADARKEVRSWVKMVASEGVRRIRQQGVEFRQLRTPGQEGDEKKEIVFNWAFLVDKSVLDDFHAQVQNLSAETAAQGLSWAISGPWPPYSFCPPLSEK